MASLGGRQHLEQHFSSNGQISPIFLQVPWTRGKSCRRTSLAFLPRFMNVNCATFALSLFLCLSCDASIEFSFWRRGPSASSLYSVGPALLNEMESQTSVTHIYRFTTLKRTASFTRRLSMTTSRFLTSAKRLILNITIPHINMYSHTLNTRMIQESVVAHPAAIATNAAKMTIVFISLFFFSCFLRKFALCSFSSV